MSTSDLHRNQGRAGGDVELPPILFLHGTFSRAALFDPWIRYFEAAGFTCHAPSLPGRDPTDRGALRRLGMHDYLEEVLAVRETLSSPPVVIGHSMGGLLAQQLAASTSCAALVCVGSVPPGILWAQPRALPHLARLLPAILAGRVVIPSERTLRAVVFNDLDGSEQRDLIPRLVPDSGRAFRSLILGLIRIPRGAVHCPTLCVSGGADRNVSARIARSIAARYDADHLVFPERGHWLIAGSAVDEVAPPILAWLNGALATANSPRPEDLSALKEPRTLPA